MWWYTKQVVHIVAEESESESGGRTGWPATPASQMGEDTKGMDGL